MLSVAAGMIMMIKAILFDISGVLHVDNVPVAGAIDAVQRARDEQIAIRFVTNTSRNTSAETLQSLLRMGFDLTVDEVLTAPGAVRLALQQRQLRPYCLVHENLFAEFADLDQRDPNAVVIADAAEGFNYANMNRAFQLVMEGAPLLGIGLNRYFRKNEKLLLDAGPFIAALEFACDIEAEILGKPARAFFQTAVKSTGFKAEEVLMIGDDAFADVEGALAAGLRACLVQTGKYCPGDEEKIRYPGSWVCPSVVEAVTRAACQP